MRVRLALNVTENKGIEGVKFKPTMMLNTPVLKYKPENFDLITWFVVNKN